MTAFDLNTRNFSHIKKKLSLGEEFHCSKVHQQSTYYKPEHFDFLLKKVFTFKMPPRDVDYILDNFVGGGHWWQWRTTLVSKFII